MTDTERKIHNLMEVCAIQPTPKTRFILINQYEIDLLEANNIQIADISYRKYDRYDAIKQILANYKEQCKEENIVLLGKGPIYNFEIDDDDKPNVPQSGLKRMNDAYMEQIANGTLLGHLCIETSFNSLKYIAEYPNMITLKYKWYQEKDPATIEKENNAFIDTLKRNYRTSLFFSPRNTGVCGIEGYLHFHKDFYDFLDSVETIYIINAPHFKAETILRYCSWSENPTKSFEHKVKHIRLHVLELFQTNPELIAYYRNPTDGDRENYLDVYYGFQNSISQIDDQIYIGNDSYRHVNYYKSQNKYNKPWFPENLITHIINVSDEVIKQDEILDNTKYEHFPIYERGENEMNSKPMLEKVAQRINELVKESPDNKIFVHCSLGVNRSPASVLFYYIKYHRMTLYEAYKKLAIKRRIFTSIPLFEILQAEDIRKDDKNPDKDVSLIKTFFDMLRPSTTQISPLKLRTHYAMNFCERTAYMFALYDMIHLDNLYLD